MRHAQDRFESDFGYEAATPAGSITLPGRFSGWRGAITLGELFGPDPPQLFKVTGRLPNGAGRLYRVYQENKQRPLYIGMAYEASIQSRVASHFKSVMTKAGNLAKTRRVGNLAALGAAQVGALRAKSPSSGR